jgi:nitrilase
MTCTGIISKEGAKIMNIPDDFVSNAAVPTEGGGFAAIYAPDGRKLAQATDQFTDQLVTATIDLDDIHRHKQMADCIGH